MASFIPASRLCRRLSMRQNLALLGRRKHCDSGWKWGNCAGARCLNGIAGIDSGFSSPAHSSGISRSDGIYSNANVIQRRTFLGCGDGEEGSMLSKVYKEKRVLGYSPEQMFAVVAAVDMYEDFLPWCQRSEILRRNPDGSFDAELEIGFKFLVESYVSHVDLKKPSYIKTTVSESNLFDHLINIWEFNPGPSPGTCNLHFSVDFKFQSPLYHQVANMFFKEVVSRLVSSFSDRCRLIYGPGVPVHEKTYEQRT
ncbi:hypothetical protein DM860_006608 [Cuscuta australis]|uniref:Coenzyme Q-binding protein COQ10 START domain-containing protein n=1 Tax=Cuscuta australis TaxID=267555 RepID=A0A328D7T6_9ASTE|nr:hypothetical protein DM860_006608 [Cuscuta australis]